MKYLQKTTEYLLYLLVFSLPLQTRWIIKAGELNGGYSEYLTLSLYGTDLLLIVLVVLFAVNKITNYKLQIHPSSEYKPNKSQNSNLKTNSLSSRPSDSERRDPLILSLKPYYLKPIWLAIVGLELFIFISIFFAPDKLVAFQAYLRFILGVGLFWIITQAGYNKLKLIYSIIAGASLQALIGIWQFLSQSDFTSKWLGDAFQNPSVPGVSVIELAGGERYLRAYGSLDHPNILGVFLAMVLLIAISVKLQAHIVKYDSNINFIIKYLIFTILFSALFFSFSRTAWAVFIVGILLNQALADKYDYKKYFESSRILCLIKKFRLIIFTLLLILVFSFLFNDFIKVRFSHTDRLAVKAYSERVDYIKDSIELIKQRPLYGVGPGNYVLAMSELYPENDAWYYQPVHNIFLLIAVELGLLGLLCFLFLLAEVLLQILKFNLKDFKLLKTNNDSDLNLISSRSSLVLFFALFISFMSDHWFWSLHFGIYLFWLILGLIYISGVQKKIIFANSPPA